MLPYCLFKDKWTDDVVETYGPIPGDKEFKAQITAINGITYSVGRKTSPLWKSRTRVYLGVRLRALFTCQTG